MIISNNTIHCRATFRSAWKTIPPQSKPTIVDHLCIDMNQILHSSIRSTSNPNGLIFKIFTEVDDIIRLVQPRKSLGDLNDFSNILYKNSLQNLILSSCLFYIP